MELYIIYKKQKRKKRTYLSLAILEFLDIDFGDISKSESDLYKNDSRRCGRFCSTRPALGDPPSRGERAPPGPFSTSKLEQTKKLLLFGILWFI